MLFPWMFLDNVSLSGLLLNASHPPSIEKFSCVRMNKDIIPVATIAFASQRPRGENEVQQAALPNAKGESIEERTETSFSQRASAEKKSG